MFWLFLCEHALKTVKPLPDGVDVPPWIADKKIGDYRLLASIGKGGFGEVFLAENRDGNRKAVKIFTPKRKGPVAFNLEYDGMRMAEFAGVHQNLVPIESVGRTEHCVYYTMPLASGRRNIFRRLFTMFSQTARPWTKKNWHRWRSIFWMRWHICTGNS